MNIIHSSCLCGFLLLFTAGCSGSADGPQRVAVEGEVTFEGKPVAVGTATFTPAEGNNGPSAGTAIEDGRYEIPAAQGPVSGKYLVILNLNSETDGKPGLTPIDGSKPPFQSFQFSRTIAEDDNQFDFYLPGDVDK